MANSDSAEIHLTESQLYMLAITAGANAINNTSSNNRFPTRARSPIHETDESSSIASSTPPPYSPSLDRYPSYIACPLSLDLPPPYPTNGGEIEQPRE